MSGEAGEIAKLVCYVSELPRPDDRAPWGRASEPYDHIGAKLADATLQRATNYENVVRTRVERIARAFPTAATTGGLIELIDAQGAAEILKMRGGAKPKTFEALARWLQAETIDSVENLTAFLSDSWKANRLLVILGVGPKTVAFLKLVVGLDAVAVDMHILAALKAAGIPRCDASEVETLFRGAAAQLGMRMRDLDALIWRHHSDLARRVRAK